MKHAMLNLYIFFLSFLLGYLVCTGHLAYQTQTSEVEGQAGVQSG